MNAIYANFLLQDLKKPSFKIKIFDMEEKCDIIDDPVHNVLYFACYPKERVVKMVDDQEVNYIQNKKFVEKPFVYEMNWEESNLKMHRILDSNSW